MNDYQIEEHIAYIPGTGTAVSFTNHDVKFTANGMLASSGKGTAVPVKKLQNSLNIAPWGEDNRFPQNIVKLMDYYGVGKRGLRDNAKSLYGNGIIPGIVEGFENAGNTEIFSPLDPKSNNQNYIDLKRLRLPRFLYELALDLEWFYNGFIEVVLSNDCKTITHFVTQEACDCRFQQMDENGIISKLYLSKLWGLASDQYIKFDPDKKMPGLVQDSTPITEIDNKYIKSFSVIDTYDPLESLKDIAKSLAKRPDGKIRSAILPLNYPSHNKTYYQLADWDAVRLNHWIEIAIKVPSIILSVYQNALQLQSHVEVPQQFLYDLAGGEAQWTALANTSEGKAKKKEIQRKLLKDIEDFLKGEDKAGSTFVSYYAIDKQTGKEKGSVRFNFIKRELNFDKDLLTSAAANSEFLFAANINPDQIGAGIPGGAYGGNKGGSNIREGKTVADSQLPLHRAVLLEPLQLFRDYNREVGNAKHWTEDIEFRFAQTKLTTLDKGKGQEQQLAP